MLWRLLVPAFLLTLGVVSGQPAKIGQGYDFPNNGKVDGPRLAEVYTPSRAPTARLPVAPAALAGARLNQRYLARLAPDKSFAVGNLRVTAGQLQTAGSALVRQLHNAEQTGKPIPLDGFSLLQIHGEDGCGNVHYTGYYTPLLEARTHPDSRFRFPLYALPPKSAGKLPDREAIDAGKALAGQGLELAYTDEYLDTYFLQVQGSGVLRFADGSTRLLGFKGVNGHSYFSIGRYLVAQGLIPPERICLRAIRQWFDQHPEQLLPTLYKNKSYVFFAWRTDDLLGAAGLPLTAGHSVAVDPKFIPYGACLLGEVPVLDQNGDLTGHRWELLFAHDTGGAIKGPGHLDWYHGLGRDAGERAGDLHHYGRLWLILPAGNP